MLKLVDPSINPAIHARQTALLYRNAGLGQLFTVMASLPTAYLGYISQPGAPILAWVACMVIVAFFRYRLARRYWASRPAETEASYWSAHYIRLTVVQAFAWLAGCIPIMWGNSDSFQFLVALVMVGMVAGAVPVLSSVKLAFRAYAVPIIIGATVVSFADASGVVHYVLGVLLLIFLGGVTRSSDHFNEMLLESFTLELEKGQLVRKAEAAVRVKSEFLANISHEIRTPMNSILGMAQLAYKAEREPRQRDYLNKIQQSGEHLLSIIDDILDLSKIDAGKLTIEVVDFELAKVIENMTNLVAEKAKDKNLRLLIEVDPAVPRFLQGDPLRICQLLTNLTNNAIKFTERGEVVVYISRVEDGGDGVPLRFEVRDTGIGMNEEEMALLFRSFQQTDSSTTRKYGGTGLGLVICKQLVEMMEDGRIGVQSAPGEGSTFWFTVRLPEGIRPEPQAAKPEWEDDGVHESALVRTISGARILLVDDNEFNLEVATDFLQGVGAQVATARNGSEAIALLHQAHYDCVLMDMQMPVMDGVEAVRQIRADPAIADVPVIAMTANALQEDRERYLAAGMDDCITKPFKYETLFLMMAKWLPGVQAGEALAAPAADATLAGDPDVIDLSVLAELTGSDRSKISEMAGKFIASIRQQMEVIEAALERKDLDELGALGHYNKAPARMVGALGFAKLCQALEDNARGGDVDCARDIVDRLRLLPAQIEQHVTRVLA